MANIPSGLHIISMGDEQSLTSGGSEIGAPVVILPPTGVPGQQEWHVEERPNGRITLKNLQSGKYAGFRGEPEVNQPIVAVDTPTEFMPRAGGERGLLEVVGTTEEVLGLGLSLLRIFPPRTALRPLQEVPAWRFQFLE